MGEEEGGDGRPRKGSSGEGEGGKELKYLSRNLEVTQAKHSLLKVDTHVDVSRVLEPSSHSNTLVGHAKIVIPRN